MAQRFLSQKLFTQSTTHVIPSSQYRDRVERQKEVIIETSFQNPYPNIFGQPYSLQLRGISFMLLSYFTEKRRPFVRFVVLVKEDNICIILTYIKFHFTVNQK